MTYLKFTEEHKTLLPYIAEFFNELSKEDYSKMAKTIEFIAEEDTPEEIEEFVEVSKGDGFFEMYDVNVIKGILNFLSICEKGYISEAGGFKKLPNFNHEDFEILVTRNSIVDVDEEEFNLPDYPFEDGNGKPVYRTFLDMGADGYWGYELLVKPEEGAVLVLKYTDPLMGGEYSKEDGFEAVTYNFKTKKLSLSYLVECDEY